MGANGKVRREYLLSSLPAAAQMKWAAQSAERSLAGTRDDEVAVQEAAPLFAAHPEALANVGQRSTVPPELEEQARARYQAIAPLLDFAARTNGQRPTFRARDGRKITNLEELAGYMAAQQEPPVGAMTVWRWLRRFRAGGYAALADRARSDAGQSRIFARHPAAAAFAQAKYLHEGLANMRLVHEALAREWTRLEKKGQAPSYACVRAYLQTIPRPVVTLAHEGPQALHSRHSPFILRKAPPAMDWWIADHRIFDVRMRNTIFGSLKDEQAFRLWGTYIYDWGSRYLVGYCFAPTPSSNTINSALRMALTRFGFPRNFYWDNGKDFKSVGERLREIETSEGLRALLQHEKVAFGVTHALPKRPRSKPIEAYFTRWSKRFDVLWRGAYRGNRTENRPERAIEADRQHQKFLDGKRPDSPLPSDRQFITAGVQWIEEYNTQARLQALDSRTPEEVLDEQYPPETRVTAPRRALDALLMKDDVRTVLGGGCVEICSMRYEPKPQSLGPLYLHQGRRALILRDPYDFSEAVAKDPETHEFIGELALQMPLEQSPGGAGNDDELRARLRNERALARACRNYIEAVAAGASASGWQCEVDALLERAARRTGTDDFRVGGSGTAAPGAREKRQLPERAPYVPDSPFNDDAARKCIEAMKEEG